MIVPGPGRLIHIRIVPPKRAGRRDFRRALEGATHSRLGALTFVLTLAMPARPRPRPQTTRGLDRESCCMANPNVNQGGLEGRVCYNIHPRTG